MTWISDLNFGRVYNRSWSTFLHDTNHCIQAQNRFAPIFAASLQEFLIGASFFRIGQAVLEDILLKTYHINPRFDALVLNAFPADSRSSHKASQMTRSLPAAVVT